MPNSAELALLNTAHTNLTNIIVTDHATFQSAKSGYDATKAAFDVLVTEIDNTLDADKPISAAASTALGQKQASLVSGTNIKTINNQSLLGSENISIVVTSTTTIVVQYDDRANLRLDPVDPNQVNDTITVKHIGMVRWVNTVEEPDDDETCFTSATGLGQWILSEPHYDLIQAHAMVEKSFRDDYDEDEPYRFAAYLTSQGIS